MGTWSWVLALAILCGDLVSKYLVQSSLPLMSYFPSYPYGGIGVFENFLGIQFSITHLTNKGAAWGALGEYQFPLLLFRMALIGALLGYLFWSYGGKRHPLPFVLIIAGAIGNVLDYFFYGHVVDMFHFVLWGYDFPVFNVADSAVTLGMGSLILLSLFQEQPKAVSE